MPYIYDLPEPLPKEDLSEYALRIGFPNNEYPNLMAWVMTLNPKPTDTVKDKVNAFILSRSYETTDWFHHKLYDPTSPYYIPPIVLPNWPKIEMPHDPAKEDLTPEGVQARRDEHNANRPRRNRK